MFILVCYICHIPELMHITFRSLYHYLYLLCVKSKRHSALRIPLSGKISHLSFQTFLTTLPCLYEAGFAYYCVQNQKILINYRYVKIELFWFFCMKNQLISKQEVKNLSQSCLSPNLSKKQMEFQIAATNLYFVTEMVESYFPDFNKISMFIPDHYISFRPKFVKFTQILRKHFKIFHKIRTEKSLEKYVQ